MYLFCLRVPCIVHHKRSDVKKYLTQGFNGIIVQSSLTQRKKEMNINDMTLGQIKEVTNLIGGSSEKRTPFATGEKYLIRTVTHIDVGRVVDVIGDFLIMEDASWIADTGRYHDCLTKGIFNEIEPYPGIVFVNMGSIIDGAIWNHDLPTDQK